MRFSLSNIFVLIKVAGAQTCSSRGKSPALSDSPGTEQPEDTKQTIKHRRSNIWKGLQHCQNHGDGGQEHPRISPFKQWYHSSKQANRTRKGEHWQDRFSNVPRSIFVLWNMIIIFVENMSVNGKKVTNFTQVFQPIPSWLNWPITFNRPTL